MAKVNGSGSIVQLERDKPKGKCRKWQLRVSLGLDPRTGRYPQRTKTFSGTYTQAKAALRDFIDSIEGGAVPMRTGWTFEEYGAHYIEARAAAGDAAPQTLRVMRTHLKACAAHLGKANVAAVTPAMISDMYAAMRAGDTLSGKPASGTYLGHIHEFLGGMYKHAVQEGVVAESPLSAVTRPRRDTEERTALTATQARAFIAALDPMDTHHLAYLLAVTMGLRCGEVCALSWEDVDLEAGVLHVAHSYDNQRNLKGPKTEAGNRYLPMPAMVAEALAARRAERGAACPIAGTDPVITTRAGARVTPYRMDHWWSADRERLGAGGLHFHDLRHTYISLLAQEGVHPKVMQVLAGHETAQITMDVYAHVNLDSKREAVSAVDGLFAA